MSEIELKSCPICGRDVYIGTEDYDNEILDAVICDYCNLRFYGSFSTKEELIKQWNTRKPMERIVERLEDIRQVFSCNGFMESETMKRAIEIVKEEGGLECQEV